MAYNTTFLTNVTGITPLVEGVNEASGGWLFSLILLLTFFIAVFTMREADFTINLLGSSFMTSFVAALFFAAGYVPGYAVTIPVVVFLVAVVAKMWDK